jgi:hypothetical protein
VLGIANVALAVDAFALDPVRLVNEPVASSDAAPLSIELEAAKVELATTAAHSHLFAQSRLSDAALETRENWRDFGGRSRQQVHQDLDVMSSSDDLLLLAIDRVGNFPQKDVPATVDDQSRDRHIIDRDGPLQFDEPLAVTLAARP